MEMHRLELCWTDRQTDRQSEFSPNVGRKLRNTNARLIMTEEVYENEVKLLNLSQEELHSAQAEELQRRDQQLLHERLLQQISELREAHDKKSQ